MKKAVIYWSGTGNTAAMANAIAAGMGEGTELFSVDQFTGDVADYDKIAFGCSAMGDEVLEESEFDPFFSAIEGKLSGKKVALFGSYGWGDGQWMRDWAARTAKAGANLYDEGLMVNGFPDAAAKVECTAFGEGFSAY
nr:flavodoxin [uncultured Anaerotignum sp.]